MEEDKMKECKKKIWVETYSLFDMIIQVKTNDLKAQIKNNVRYVKPERISR